MPSPTTSAATPPQTTGSSRRNRRAKRRRLTVAVLAAAALGAWPLTLSFAATAPTTTSPGTFTGWAFDACAAPSASTMDAWLKDKTDPYRGIGIYISGSLRACSQSNLTSTWVSHVQQAGWHLLPLTVGPQASCTGFSQVINATPTNTYAAARRQGAAQADDAVAHARALGINPGSTLFYDMENWHTGYNNCDASALWFMSAWTNRLHAYGYAGGTYVSGLSGARLLNAMADDKPSGFVLPDQIWVAEWNNQENVKSNYLDATNWSNHQRAHQYYGGHNATNSGITLNIDSNYVDLRPVAPIPAVVPDSAIGALPTPPPATPTPSKAPTPTKTPTPTKAPTTKAPTATPTTATPTPSAKPTQTVKPSPSVTAKPSAPTSSASTVSKPVTTKPTPSAPATSRATSPTPTKAPAKQVKSVKKAPATKKSSVKPKATAKPKKTVKKALTTTVNHLTSQLGSATGIKLPTLPAARALTPKLASRVPSMETRSTVQSSAPVRKSTSTTRPSTAPTTASPAPKTIGPDAQAAPLQPQLPGTVPTTIDEQPSLVVKIWHSTQGVLLTIGHALAGAAGWVGRGFASMLGW